MKDIFEDLRTGRVWFDNDIRHKGKLNEIEIIKKRIDVFYRDYRDPGLPHAAQEVTDD